MGYIGDYVHYWYSSYEKYGITRNTEDSDNYNSIFAFQKAKILNGFTKVNNNYLGLQNALNNLIYPNGSFNMDLENTQKMEKLMGEEALKWAVRIGQGKGSAQSRRISTNVFFYNTTIIQLKNQVENVKLMLENSKQTKKIEMRLKVIQNLLEQINQIYDSLPSEAKTGGSRKRIMLNDTTRQMMRNLNSTLADISNATNQQAIGKAFEATIGTIDDRFDTALENFAYDFIESQILTGSVQASVQGAAILPSLDSSYIEKDKTIKIHMDGKFQDKNMKMDVNLQYNNENYRISAKSYGFLMNNRVNLGESRLLDILQKTGSSDFVNHYLNAATSRWNNNKFNTRAWNDAHEIATLTIIAEALSGYSQKNGYADYFILNNRAAKQIVVKPIKELLNPLQEKLFIISNYNIPSKWYEYNKWQGKKIGNESDVQKRLSNLIHQLHKAKIKVSLRANSL